ncbi:hypothetical protein QL285_015441 [Trifolium repens]|jgi:hypothetical protein|nr:hypothetical protein QL285_015441 [Trifolium repens]
METIVTRWNIHPEKEYSPRSHRATMEVIVARWKKDPETLAATPSCHDGLHRGTMSEKSSHKNSINRALFLLIQHTIQKVQVLSNSREEEQERRSLGRLRASKGRASTPLVSMIL